MLQITKQGNSIVVEGLNHYFYPYNGTLEVPCNSVITVVDEGDIVLFRSAANYDVLFSAKIDEIAINGQSVTKDNVGEVFGALSNVSSGGGGLTPEQEEKLNNAVQISDYNADKATQTTIDEAQNTEINKLRGDVEGKQSIIQDLNEIREGANLGKTALQEETDPVWTAEKVNYYTKSDIDTSLEVKANKTEIPTVPTNVSAFTNDAGYLTEHQSLNDYYTKTEVDTSLESKANKTEIPTVPTNVSAFTNDAGYLTEHQSLDNYYTKTEVNSSLETKANKTEIPTVPTNVSAFTNDAGYLTEHQSLDNYYTKTESDGKYATQVVVNEEIAARISDIREVKATLESKADKSEIPSLNGYATEQWVGEQGYLTEHQTLKTINGETIVGNGNIEISSGEETDPIWNAEKVNYYTKTEVNSSLESKADKTEIPIVPTNVSAFTNDAGYLTEHQSLDNYYTKTEVNASLETKANKTEIPTVPTNVSAFTNDAGYLTEHQPLKTINGETIVGNGDITISGGEQISDILILPQNVEFTYKDGNKYKVVIRDISYNSTGGLDYTINIWKNGVESTNTRKFGYIVKTISSWISENYNPSVYGYKISNYNIPDYVYIFSDDDNTIDENKMYFDLDITLISGTNIKTINGESILGSGDLVISGGGEETDPVWTAEKVNYYTKTEVNTSLESKANKSEIPTVPTNVSAFTNDAGYLTQHQTLKTINGQTIVGDGNIEITSGEETDPIWTAEKVNYYTKTEVNSSLETKADKSEIPSLNGYATEQWVGQQGYLTQHQSLDNYYTKSEIDGIVGNVNNALSEIING